MSHASHVTYCMYVCVLTLVLQHPGGKQTRCTSFRAILSMNAPCLSLVSLQVNSAQKSALFSRSLVRSDFLQVHYVLHLAAVTCTYVHTYVHASGTHLHMVGFTIILFTAVVSYNTHVYVHLASWRKTDCAPHSCST